MTFVDTDHPRDRAGRFTEKGHSAPEVSLAGPSSDLKDSLVRYRAARGYDLEESEQLLEELLQHHGGDNLAFRLHYNQFATERRAHTAAQEFAEQVERDRFTAAAHALAERAVFADHDILSRGYRGPNGEVADFLVRDGDALVVAKLHASTRSDGAFAGLTPRTAGRLRDVAHAWKAANPDHAGLTVRVDAIAVTAPLPGEGETVVEHVAGIS